MLWPSYIQKGNCTLDQTKKKIPLKQNRNLETALKLVNW